MEWISVKDQMPEEFSIVLVYSINPEEGGVYCASYIPGGLNEDGNPDESPWQYTFNDLFNLKDVTHWMEMPAPPSVF